MTLRSLLPALAMLALGFAAGPLHAAPAPHPRLILTPDRITLLKARLDTTHREFWARSLASAEQFSREKIPAMANANNRYRTFGDTLPVLGLSYRITGDRRYVDAAARWLDAFLAVAEWNGSQNLGRAAWVVGSALTYDWLHDVLPEGERKRVSDRLVAEGEILLVQQADYRLLSNHCLIETTALGMIGLALQGENARAEAFLARARERAELIIKYAPLDGSWGEGTQYWQYGLGYFLRFLEASKTSGDRDYYGRYDWLKKTGFFPINFSLPGRPEETVNFSDSGGHEDAAFLLYLPASIYRNGYFQDYANRTRPTHPYKFSWMDLIAYDPTVVPQDFTTLPPFAHFEDNGFVIMRSGWRADDTLIGFHCGPAPGHRNQSDPRRLDLHGFGPGHGHPDANSFCLFAHGQWLAIDPGYVHEKWTRDHNTVLINGRGQAGEGSGEWLDYMAFESREPAPRILRAESTPDFDYLIGDAGNIYVDEAGADHFRRHLLFLKPDIVVVLDDLGGKRPSRFEWLLQAHDQAVQTGPRTFEITREGVRLSIQPIWPEALAAQIATRPLRGSATDGHVTTLTLAADSAPRTAFLVVLSVLPNAAAGVPVVEWRNDRLQIRSARATWNVAVTDPARDADAADVLLKPSRP